jgi:hypothetical protein
MSKSGKSKYRWVDEEYDDYSSDRKSKKKDCDKRNERRLKNAIKGKNLDYLMNNDGD